MLTLISLGVLLTHWKEILAVVAVITVVIILLIHRRNKAIRAAAAAAKAAQYIGNKHTQVYHKRGCHTLRGLPSSQLIVFSTNADAAACGYKPCQVCKPRG